MVRYIADSKFEAYHSDYAGYYWMTWLITKACNFSCDYCYQRRFKRTSKQNPYSADMAQWFNDTERNWIVYISGGEPFLYPGFVQLCHSLTRNHILCVNTNLSTTNVPEFGKTIEPSRVLFIYASVHIIEREKRDPDLHTFLNNFLFLSKNHFNIVAAYVAYPPLFTRMEKDVLMLRSLGINPLYVKPFRGYYKGRPYPESYSEAEKKLIYSLGIDSDQDQILRCDHKYFGRVCNAGKTSFHMDPLGNIKRCARSARILGKMFYKDLALDNATRPCPFPSCLSPHEAILSACSVQASLAGTLREVAIETAVRSFRKINKTRSILLNLSKEYSKGAFFSLHLLP